MIDRDVELLTGQSGGYAYNGNTEQVYLELRWTAGGAGNVLQASDNLASLANTAQARTNLGLGNIDNTSDANKPISAATQTALGGKASASHTHAQYVDSADPRLSDARPASDVSAWAKAATKPGYTKTDVGLGNVDNTSDANKPVSTATQTALNTKQDTLVSGTSIKTINNTSLLGAGDLVLGADPATQAEMEAGTEAGLRAMSPLRVKQAIAALTAGTDDVSGQIAAAIKATRPARYYFGQI